MKAVIAGGGTGGHVFPGMAVAEEFRKRDEKAEVVFIGTEQGIESRVVPREGYPIRFIRASGVLGKSPLGKAVSLYVMARAVYHSRSMLGALGPDIVIGTGGYVSAPPVVAARTMSIPTMILEQNMAPGLANRMLGRLTDAVAVSYHESLAFFPRAKTRLTGNPIRGGIMRGNRAKALGLFSLDADRFTVVVLGGSRGARKINDAAIEALTDLLDIRDGVQFLHQTGEEGYEAVRRRYRELGFKAMVAPFVYQMAEAYALADTLVSRAGATTLAELTALGKAAILIPYPHAAGHQEANARKLEETGGCRVIADRELSGPRLAGDIKRLHGSEGLRAEMCRQSRALGRPDAAQKVVDMAFSIVRAKRGDV